MGAVLRWGWTCKYSGHCNPDLQNQAGIPEWCSAWLPKLFCHAGAQIGFIGLMKKLLVKFCNLCSSQSPTRQPNQPKIHRRGILQDLRCPDPKPHKVMGVLHPPPSFLLEGWKLKFQCQQKSQEIPGFHQRRNVEVNSYFYCMFFLINDHLPPPFPSVWVSGVGPSSSRTFIPNWWLPMAGKWWDFINCVLIFLQIVIDCHPRQGSWPVKGKLWLAAFLWHLDGS